MSICGDEACEYDCDRHDVALCDTFSSLVPKPQCARVIRLDNECDAPEWDYLRCKREDKFDSIELPLCAPEFADLPRQQLLKHSWTRMYNWFNVSDGCCLELFAAVPFGGIDGTATVYNGLRGRPNKHIRILEPTGCGGSVYPWSSTAYIVAWKHELHPRTGKMRARWQDVTMDHYRLVVDWFLSSWLNSSACMGTHLREDNSTFALKINSDGEKDWTYSDSEFRRMDDAATVYRHPLFVLEDIQWASPLAYMLGLPWVCRIAPSHLEISRMSDMLPDALQLLKNDKAILLSAQYIDPVPTPGRKRRHLPQIYSFQNLRFNPYPGTVMIIHANGGLVAPEHVDAFNEFVGRHLRASDKDPSKYQIKNFRRSMFMEF
ncbi:hypothetical protein PFICI_14611 [Pestalotiopsis fici W106-1]|uniref:Uncharacterized protein n=1 Tax=Pestalotiopsis fici (strain W106-1 / CGMCC3.15140) TaxID=1229662 RepID=W3WIB1_PESFW|nr:uncharacterized protein PFICI_14611 [Pestalotiopsis fici W106-1]ETS73665.1 hypothetical protein PFICI_14611 [Pestalotiopsis fici W106-1]